MLVWKCHQFFSSLQFWAIWRDAILCLFISAQTKCPWMKMNITVIFPTAEKSRYFHQTFLSLNKNYYWAGFSFSWVIMKINWDNTENLAEISIHSVSDYKKHLYKKRLVDHVFTKKRTLVYFSDLRNTFCRKLFLLKELRQLTAKFIPHRAQN